MTRQRTSPTPRTLLLAGAALVLVAAMALDTKVVRDGAPGAAQNGAFSPSAYGKTEFPKVRDAVIARAVDATVLADALRKDPAAAQKQYAVMTDGGAEYAVRFTGVAGKKDEDSGNVPFRIEGLGDKPVVSVQTGPAIMGTDLRDGTGQIQFGQFSNQIDYQNAGSGLNAAMKQAVLAPLGTADLAGKTLSVVGVFQLSDPDNWTVTPVAMEAK